MGRIFVVYLIFYFACLFNLNAFTGFQEDELSILSPALFQWDISQFAQSRLRQPRLIQPRLIQPKLIQRNIAQSQVKSSQNDFEEPGAYAIFPPSRKVFRRFRFRVFGGFNFASSIKSEYSDSTRGFGTEEYIFPHTSLLGSISFGGSFLFLFTKEIGAMFSASYEIESRVETYKYNNESGLSRGGSCGASRRDTGYLVCSLYDQFRYSIISLELSGYYEIMPLLYVFAGPNFFIPVGFRVQPTSGQVNPVPFEIKGGLGGQAGAGFIYKNFFVEGLFKTQNFTLEGIRVNTASRGFGVFETGRLWGFMVRGGFQF